MFGGSKQHEEKKVEKDLSFGPSFGSGGASAIPAHMDDS